MRAYTNQQYSSYENDKGDFNFKVQAKTQNDNKSEYKQRENDSPILMV